MHYTAGLTCYESHVSIFEQIRAGIAGKFARVLYNKKQILSKHLYDSLVAVLLVNRD